MSGDIVQVYYPNEWKKSLQGSGIIADEELETFNWFLCSQRIYDEKADLYYLNISTNVQFFCANTGKTLLARGLSKRGQKYKKQENVRAKLIILSDAHNKKVLCRKYNYLCGCDSSKDILSRECDLVAKKEYLMKGLKKSVKLGFDGVVIQHVPGKNLGLLNCLICQNATFVFKKGVLEEVGKNFPDRCKLIKYAKKHNSEFRKINAKFPTCTQIDELLKENKCSHVSKILYDVLSKLS